MINEEFDEILILLRNLIKRAYISKEIINNSEPYLKAQVTYFDKTTNAEMIFPYGMQAIPPKETIGLLLNILGYEDNLVFIPYAQNERFKILLAEGEVVIGSPKSSSYIYFKSNGEINIESKEKLTINVNGDVELKANNVKIDAKKTDLGVGGKKIALDGDSVIDSKVVASGTNTSI